MFLAEFHCHKGGYPRPGSAVGEVHLTEPFCAPYRWSDSTNRNRIRLALLLLPVVTAVEITVMAVISVVVMVGVSVAVALLDRVSVSELHRVTTTMVTDPILAVISSSESGLDAGGRCGRS
jgi:hypothetical protein